MSNNGNYCPRRLLSPTSQQFHLSKCEKNAVVNTLRFNLKWLCKTVRISKTKESKLKKEVQFYFPINYTYHRQFLTVNIKLEFFIINHFTKIFLKNLRNKSQMKLHQMKLLKWLRTLIKNQFLVIIQLLHFTISVKS